MTEEDTKAPIDWELVEKHYRAGVMSLRQIASECGGTEGAIRKRAKKDGWTRNLTARIQDRADELVRKELVRTVSTQLTPASEKETVEIAAQATATILIVQKGSIARSHALFKNLLAELEATTDNKELFGQLGELMANPDEKGNMDKMTEIFRKVVSMGGRIDSAKKLIEILEKTVKLEREAFGVDRQDAGESGVDSALKRLMEYRKSGVFPA